MNVVTYARFSSHNQTEQSIEGQLKYCREYAERNDFNIIHSYIDEARSGTSDSREQFQQMIEDSKKKEFEGVLVYQLDRFARNREDSAKYKGILRRNGVRVYSARENITEDASGILMESVLEGMAEYYSKELGQKAARGMATNADHFYFNGSVTPLGLTTKPIPVPIGANGEIKYKKVYDIDKEKAPLVQEVFSMYLNGETMENIANYLKTKGIKTSRGKDRKFSKNSVKLILSNKKYIGIYAFKGKETPNIIPRIIDDETFFRVQEKLKKNKHSSSRAKSDVQYLLTTKLFCGTCGEMMVGTSGTSGNRITHYYYGCKNKLKHKCNRKNIKKDYIEDLVVNLARRELTDDNINEMATAVYKTAYEAQDSTKVKRLQREILNLQNARDNLFDSLKICYDNKVKQSIFEEISKIEEQKTQLQNQIKEEENNIFIVSEKEIKYFLKNLQNGNKNDLKYRQMLINVLIYKVYIYDDNITIIYNSNGKPIETKIPKQKELEKMFQVQKNEECSNKEKISQPCNENTNKNISIYDCYTINMLA